MIQIIYAIVFFIGAALLVFGIKSFEKAYQLKKEGLRAKATVIRYTSHASDKGSTMFSPVFKFRSVQGKDVEAYSSISTSYQPYKIGETVELIYERNRPERAKTINFWNFYLLPFILLTFATPMLLISIGNFLFEKGYI
ncbi:MAG: DUF3592 domain-containing protein [Capnocytophaga sp.]|nr:DUF3592 domain-containing protein [Capnocytophaga sp.]